MGQESGLRPRVLALSAIGLCCHSVPVIPPPSIMGAGIILRILTVILIVITMTAMHWSLTMQSCAKYFIPPKIT